MGLTPRGRSAGAAAGRLVAAALLTGAPAAAAHPFQASLYGHELSLVLRAGELRVAATFEEPTPEVLRDYQRFVAGAPGPAAALSAQYLERRLDELAGAIEIYADGQRVPARREQVPGRNGTGGADFIKYRTELRAELPAGTRGIGVVDRAHPDERVVWSWAVQVDPALRVDDATLLRRGDGGWSDLSGGWMAGGDHREQRVSIGRRGGIRIALGELGGRLGAPWPRSALWSLGEAASGGDQAAVARGAAVVCAAAVGGICAAWAALRRLRRPPGRRPGLDT